MYKLILLVILLSGCASHPSQTNKPISDSDRVLLKRAVIVSTLGDDLHCSFVGLTIFNNKSKTYKLDTSFNQDISSNIASKLNTMGIDARPISRDTLSFIDTKKGAKDWNNITFSDLPDIDKDISNVVIFDGSYHYASTGGYYARDNALNTYATLYVYEFPSGKLIGKSSSHRSNPKRSFSCTQESMPTNDYMLTLVKKSGYELQQELVETLFSAGSSHNKSIQPIANAPAD